MSGSAEGFAASESLKMKNENLPVNQAGQAGYEEFAISSEHAKDKRDFEDERESEKQRWLDSRKERPPPRRIDTFCKPQCLFLPKRYTIAVLACVGFIISFGMRCNLIAAMLRPTNGMNMTEEAVNWSRATQSVVDSAFFWGYLVGQLPGGILASFYPANRIFGSAIVIVSFLHLLAPSAIDLSIGHSPVFYIIFQMCKGLVEGVMYPACHGIWKFWAPPLDRSRLVTLTFCGAYAAMLIGMPLSAILTDNFGWTASFYVYGICGITWYGFWLWLSFEKPSKDPGIKSRELHYIEDSLGQVQTSTFSTTPWCKFITSMPVYAIIVANFCRSWNFYLVVLFQARFMHEAFKMPVENTGFLGALPFLLMTCIVPCGGLLADCLLKSGRMSTTNVRKLFSCGGFGMEALLFLLVAYWVHIRNGTGVNLALTIGVVCSGFAISGYNVNHLDIAPRYASILMGMANTVGTVAGVLVPIAVDFLTKNHDASGWRNVFVMAACVHFVGMTFYGIFCSGELQPWAEKRKSSVDDSLGKREAGLIRHQ